MYVYNIYMLSLHVRVYTCVCMCVRVCVGGWVSVRAGVGMDVIMCDYKYTTLYMCVLNTRIT